MSLKHRRQQLLVTAALLCLARILGVLIILSCLAWMLQQIG